MQKAKYCKRSFSLETKDLETKDSRPKSFETETRPETFETKTETRLETETKSRDSITGNWTQPKKSPVLKSPLEKIIKSMKIPL